MTLANAGFKWIDLLEKEFDKSFVSLDQVLKSLSEDYEIPEMYDNHRKMLSNLGSCFIQAVHKAQTIFQSHAKQEANLVHLREELAETKASMAKLDSEKQYLVCRLQSSLLENHKLRNKSDEGVANSNADQLCQEIQLKLAQEMAVIQRVDWEAKKLEQKIIDLEDENDMLRHTQVELESELVGARLDSKYLDKELAGRIQQIQILLAGGTSQEHKQKVWSQIEAEMHLQRSKTISNMCYSKQKVKDSAANRSQGNTSQGSLTNSIAGDASETSRKTSFSGFHGRGRLKQVHIHKNDSEELGMAILGGSEHGLPIMISEVFPNTAVGRCDKICAGDVILAVNGDSFDGMGHDEAVKYLSALRGTIKFDLENRIDAEIDDVCDMQQRYYDMFGAEGDNSSINRNNAKAAQRILLNHPGKAKDVSKRSQSEANQSPSTTKELPGVHSSPKHAQNGKAMK